ncbi:MAG: NAD-dependent epimerase/dehydratase family protein [Bacteroidetes bacterium]|nr:NAD-dependent epimerase/dehydratase family protein [Bacteroidota bacterium]
MRVLLTGGTGFVGHYVLNELISKGYHVRALLRRGGAPEGFERKEIEIVRGDINDPLEKFMEDIDGIIHLVGIIKETPSENVTFEALHTSATQNVVKAAKASGVKSLVFVSANGAALNGETKYQTSKWAAEEAVRNSGLPHWCILRPGLIFGDPGIEREEFCTVVTKTLIRPFPILPIFGDGNYQLQPVHVAEVAQATVEALTLSSVNQKTITVVGRDRFPYKSILDIMTLSLKLKPKPKINLPLSLVRTGMRFAGKMLPITPDQFAMLIAGNVGDASEFYDQFEVTERSFCTENLSYLRHRT